MSMDYAKEYLNAVFFIFNLLSIHIFNVMMASSNITFKIPPLGKPPQNMLSFLFR